MSSLHEKRLNAIDQKKYLAGMIEARRYHKTPENLLVGITQEERNRVEMMAFQEKVRMDKKFEEEMKS